MKINKLTLKQQKFCDYYIETGNATEAAKRAGYSEKTARVIGQENLLKPAISDYINIRIEKAADERIASSQRILEFFTNVMDNKITDAFGLEASLDTRIEAAKNLAKRRGLTRSKAEEDLRVKLLELEVEKKKLEIEKLRINSDDIEHEAITIVDDIGDLNEN